MIPEARNRQWAWLAEQDERFSVQVSNNWKFRGLPKDHEKLRTLARLARLDFDELAGIHDGCDKDSSEQPPSPAFTGIVPSVNPNTAPSIGGQIWSLPVIKGDMMKFVHVKNADLESLGLVRGAFQSAEDIDLSTDKAVELVIQTAGMEIGDTLIMRPKAGPVAFRFRPVIVETSSGEFFMMEYDADQVARAGLTVRAYTVDRIARRPPIIGMML